MKNFALEKIYIPVSYLLSGDIYVDNMGRDIDNKLCNKDELFSLDKHISKNLKSAYLKELSFLEIADSLLFRNKLKEKEFFNYQFRNNFELNTNEKLSFITNKEKNNINSQLKNLSENKLDIGNFIYVRDDLELRANYLPSLNLPITACLIIRMKTESRLNLNKLDEFLTNNNLKEINDNLFNIPVKKNSHKLK